jgi:hypothetical protein
MGPPTWGLGPSDMGHVTMSPTRAAGPIGMTRFYDGARPMDERSPGVGAGTPVCPSGQPEKPGRTKDSSQGGHLALPPSV